MKITDITIVRRKHHADDISLTTDLPGTCPDEPFLRLHFKHPPNDDSLVYVRKHFPNTPISLINTVNGNIIEIDAKGKVDTQPIGAS